MAEPPPSEARDAAVAWLETIGADTAQTAAAAPQETIVPALASGGSSGARALAGLGALGDPHALELGEVIGEGGMGVVRAAKQLALGRTVAVKTLKTSAYDPGAALDLLREAWVTGSLEHPNVVPVHAIELDGERPSIVLKRIEGVEWSKLIANPEEVARRSGSSDQLAWNLGILLHLLDALRFAHRHGIIHRDLKPANVMIGDFGEVYLLDWGIAVSLRDDPSGRFPLATRATQLAGTPAYMAPEMLGRGDGEPLSERTDVYLVGAVLHEIIAGRPPHRGSNALAVFTSVLASRPELPASAPPELARICARAMHPVPDQRFESADALRLALVRYLEHRGSEQLASRASAHLTELRAKLEAPPGSASSDEIYRLFGACRYGFRDALATWPENEEAARGLVAAIEAVAEYELANGRAEAAVSLLGELTEPSPLLERARSDAAKHKRRVEELERIGRDQDISIGSRTRWFLVTVFGLTFTVIPFVYAMVPALQRSSHRLHVTWSAIVLACLVAAGWWARDSMRATAMNRRLASSVMFLFVVQGVLAGGSWYLGRPASELFTWNLAIYGAFAGNMAIALDGYLMIPAAAYLVAFLVSAHDQRQALWLSGACNALTTVVGVWRWRPASIRYTAEEREARSSHTRSASSSTARSGTRMT